MINLPFPPRAEARRRESMAAQLTLRVPGASTLSIYKEKENLIGILTNYFYPNYSYNRF
jgi:hypothetical protein